MGEPVRRRWMVGVGVGVFALLAAGSLPGCALVPSGRLEESQKLAQSLRSENARLTDEVLVLKTQNRDYADRALDDLRRLTARDEAIERLEQSVRAYQDDRDRLAAAYRRLAVSLGRTSDDSAVESTSARRETPPGPVRPLRADRRPGRVAEALTRDDDGDADRVPSRSSADRSDP